MSFNQTLRIVFIGFFSILIVLPNFDTIFKLDPAPQRSENRARATFPGLPHSLEEAKTLPKAFEDFYTDNFGFRNSLIKLNAAIKFFGFNTSPSEQTIIGKDGWLFLARQENVESYRNIKPFTEQELEAFTQNLRERNAWAEQHGIQYIYVVGPDSHTLNPEHLPDWATKVNPGSRLDQLIEYAKRTANIDILDVRPALREGKKIEEVSYKTDTHWNGYGAYLAYRELVNRIRTRYPAVAEPTPLSDYKFVDLNDNGLDLSKLMGLNDLIREVGREISYTKPDSWVNAEQEGLHYSTINTHVPDFPIAIVCDSLGGNLTPHFARQFSKVRYLWGYPFEPEKILAVKPKVIIHLVIERSLLWDQIPNPPEVKAALKNSITSSQ